ncbi:MAG: HNH endonuclease [Alphaproteobacteria bacterium]|nr:HNH endonuclease [Alphaproteobacteria bacterium]
MADADGQSGFRSVMSDCIARRATIDMQIDGAPSQIDDPAIWNRKWQRFSLSLVRANIETGEDEGQSDFDLASEWLLRFTAGVLALMPLEPVDAAAAGELPEGFPEGSREQVQVNRYERDRRNRAAALAIHGLRCRACGFDFGERYGEIAAGFIEVHHITPVSKLGPGYVIDPRNDLVPLCANCHRVAHRADPPLTIETISGLVESRR